jgi:hypothetical protein
MYRGTMVRRDGKGNVEFLNPSLGSWDYWLPEHDIKTRRGIIRTILNLTEKRWITGQHVHETILAAYDAIAKDPYGES